MSIIQKIKEIEDEVIDWGCRLSRQHAEHIVVALVEQMARTQKNKATMGHLGMLKVGC